MTSNTFKNCQWNNLSLEILVEICSYLDIEDRKNVCSTCKSWYDAVHTPVLWRSFTLDLYFFTVDDIHNYRNSLLVASNFGHCLKCLKIFIYPSDEVEEHRIAFRFFVGFFKILLETNQLPQLEKLSINGFWMEICRSDIYEEAILTTAKFLRTQKQLISFTLHLSTSMINGCLLLDSIDTQSLSTMRILDLTKLFAVADISCVSEILQQFLKKYSNLTELFLEWKYFGEKLMSVVAHNKNTLKYIHLTLFEIMDINPKISVECWENVISLIPDLRTGFMIHHRDDSDLPLLKELLPCNLPIKDLYVRKSSIQPEFLQYYCQNFSNTLETLKLSSINDDGLQVDDEILSLITSCSKLRILYFVGKIKANTIASIIELKIQRVIGLQELCIIMINPTIKEYEKATSLISYYENVIKSENIPFKFSLCKFSLDVDHQEDSYSESSTGEEEEEEVTESSNEEEEEEVTESTSEEEEEEVTESSSEEEEEDI